MGNGERAVTNYQLPTTVRAGLSDILVNLQITGLKSPLPSTNYQLPKS